MKVMIFVLLMAVFAISVVFFFEDEFTCILDNIYKKKKSEPERENIEPPTEDKKIKKL